MPISGNQLAAGDILFKHASDVAVSKLIRKSQKKIYDSLITTTGVGAMGGDFASDITHVAMAVGSNDVVEFDEGGAGVANLVFRRGFGFVRGNMSLDSRRGNRYEVFACTDDKLATSSADKAELVWDITHQGQRLKASYGLGKLAKQGIATAVGGSDKGSSKDLNKFEKQLDEWLKKGSESSGLFKRKPTMKFICSEFVTYCYLWAAADCKIGQVLGPDYLIGIDKARISPVELYTRLETMGKSKFQFKGTLYA